MALALTQVQAAFVEEKPMRTFTQKVQVRAKTALVVLVKTMAGAGAGICTRVAMLDHAMAVRLMAMQTSPFSLAAPAAPGAIADRIAPNALKAAAAAAPFSSLQRNASPSGHKEALTSRGQAAQVTAPRAGAEVVQAAPLFLRHTPSRSTAP